MKTKSLLEKAKAIPNKRKLTISKDEIELAVAYIKGEIDYIQYFRIIKRSGGKTYGGAVL